jgi:ribosomal protein S27AE
MVMDEMTLRDFVKDMSQTEGEPGFLFQIRCPGCRGVWESDFTPFTGNTAGLAAAAKSLFKKSAEPPPTNGAWEAAKEEALKEAIVDAEDSFRYCKSCHKYVCHSCWNTIREICLNCCAATARSAFDIAIIEQQEQLQKAQNAKCPSCGAAAPGAKFCPKCGSKMASAETKGKCGGCGSKIPPDAVFCPECGKKQG